MTRSDRIGINFLLVEDNPDDHLLVRESLQAGSVRHGLVWIDRMSGALEPGKVKPLRILFIEDN